MANKCGQTDTMYAFTHLSKNVNDNVFTLHTFLPKTLITYHACSIPIRHVHKCCTSFFAPCNDLAQFHVYILFPPHFGNKFVAPLFRDCYMHAGSCTNLNSTHSCLELKTFLKV